MMARALGGLLLTLALLAGGYWWGDTAATNRDAAAALGAERTAAIRQAIRTAFDRGADAKAGTDMFTVSSTYQEGLSHGVATQKDTVAHIRTGALRLSVPTGPAAAAVAAPAAAGAGRCDGQARAQLSNEAAEFLTGLASEADDVVLQLNACQADVKIIWEQCNAKPGEPGK